MDWKVSGDYAESCNCDIVCPCLYLQPASMGPCNAMLVWDIKEGHCDDVKLDGVKVSAFLQASSPALTEGNCKLALYIDESASDEQAAAIEKLWGGQGGGHLAVIAGLVSDLVGVKRAKIEASINGSDKSLKVEGAGGWTMSGIANADGKIAHCDQHPLEVNPGCGGVDINKTSSQDYDDHGLSWNTAADRVGLSGKFSYQP
ncbi:MAG: hypothetical protein CMD88_05455 [Gammaproteobacteria bacterium]|nr:hypothetical protein [Gammaproteobacteria bacterium]